MNIATIAYYSYIFNCPLNAVNVDLIQVQNTEFVEQTRFSLVYICQ